VTSRSIIAPLALLAMAGTTGVTPAQAAPRRIIAIGTVHTTKSCTTYLMGSGRDRVGVTPYSAYAESSWRTWLVKDCQTNFATMRTSLEAALAASGAFAVGQGGYRVNLTVSDIGEQARASVNTPGYSPEAYAVGSGTLYVALDLTITDRAGRSVYGGLITKRIETGSYSGANGFATADLQSGEGVYSVLQHEAALAAARAVAFHIAPLQVTARSGKMVRLNYGAPLLPFGGQVDVRSGDGFDRLRYRVTSADAGEAVAELEGDGVGADIQPGTLATYVEDDAPTANARRTRREELPR